MNSMNVPVWTWLVFYLAVLLMLVADLMMFGRKGQHEVSVSRDPFIVLTSNVFAILGLRALYFALAALAKYFTYLKYGLGTILIFVGIKMLLAMNEYINTLGAFFGFNMNVPHIEVPTSVSLTVIFGILLLSMLLSVMVTRGKGQK
ncbi:MAG: hypothetical protein IJJ83_09945 [Muribaculaceae bacterium]|nr:hypothetical protein [Bacteroidales bacterium]MBR0494060.1 hypothetical protein [Muribaculaceae bacterium]